MSQAPNPYQSPPPESRRQSLWSWLYSLASIRATTFRSGYPILWCGIAFFVDKREPHKLFAAVPSSIQTAERMKYLVEETLRVLPRFLKHHPHLISLIQNRTLIVRMVDNYEDLETAKWRESELQFAISDFVKEFSVRTELGR